MKLIDDDGNVINDKDRWKHIFDLPLYEEDELFIIRENEV